MVKLKPTELFGHIDKEALAPVYLFTGEDGYLIGRALSRLVERALTGAPRDFNLDVFYGKDARADEVAGQADTLPMMAERRVVVLKEADRMRDIAPLKAYIGSPSASTTLILVAEGADKAKEKTLSGTLSGSAVHVHFYRPFESDLPGWVRTMAKEGGYTIDGDAAAYVKEVLGDNLALIEAELNKVFNYVGQRKTITIDDVRESVGDFGLPVVYDFIDAVAFKKAGRALETLSKLLRDGEQPLKILGTMAGHWRKLVDARERRARGESDEQLARALRLNFHNRKSFLTQVSRLTEDELAHGFHLFREADMSLKSSALAPGMVMERLVLELTGTGVF